MENKKPNVAKDKTADNLFTNEEVSPGERKRSLVGLQQKLDFLCEIYVVACTLFGTGIFASSRFVMKKSGSVGLTFMVWCLCGVLATFRGLCYSEICTTIPSSGAEYIYLLERLGPMSAFLYSWTSVIVLKPSQFAIICLAFGACNIELFFPGCGYREDLQPVVKLLAAVAIGEWKIYFALYRKSFYSRNN